MHPEIQKKVSTPEFKNLMKDMRDISNTFSNISKTQAQVTESLHALMDETNSLFIEKVAETGKKIPCAKGCSFCCYLIVEITASEAELMTKEANRLGVVIDRNALNKQLPHATVQKWSALPYHQRKCVFLKNGSCSVYAQRPAACRKYFVVTDPKLCDEETYPEIPGALMPFNRMGTAITYTIMQNEIPNAGSLPQMVAKVLDNDRNT